MQRLLTVPDSSAQVRRMMQVFEERRSEGNVAKLRHIGSFENGQQIVAVCPCLQYVAESWSSAQHYAAYGYCKGRATHYPARVRSS